MAEWRTGLGAVGSWPRPQPVLAGVNGTWFIWVMGTQSIAVALPPWIGRTAVTPEVRPQDLTPPY